MNALDFCLIILFVAFLVMRRNMSFSYYFLSSSGLFAGYFLGILIAPHLTENMSSEIKRGAAALGLMIGLALLLCLIGMLAGKKLRMKIILSRFFTLDKWLALPYKIIIVMVALIVLSQTLIYIPMLALQFEAQGSTLLFSTDKFIPRTLLESRAQKISPDQFRNLRLEYDPNPLTYNNIANAGEFQNVIDKVAPSVVKISGRSCVGLGFGSGFIVAPGLVTTNAHVVGGASSIYISDHEGSYPATPILIDQKHDLAILYSKFITAKPIPLSSSQDIIGTKAMTVGYPAGGDLKMSQGVISGNGYKSTNNELNSTNTITLNSTLGPGSSGGPLLNLNGEVVGVNDAGAVRELIAIKSEVVKDLLIKAKKKLHTTNTEFCSVPPKFY